MIAEPNQPDTCERSPLPKPESVFPVIVRGADQTESSLDAGAHPEIRYGASREDLTPMSSRGLPLAVLVVNLSHEYRSE
jgi:hypothetical protein